jgi:serine protease DegQ
VAGIVRDAQPGVVAIFARAGAQEGQGSGVIWREDGIIVTNQHVVAGAQQVRVALATGERVDADVRAADRRTDLAILDIDEDDLPVLEFADELPEVGELAVALGNPLGFENSATAGIVSGLNRAIPSAGRTPALVDLVQTDAAISPGSSGGPLVGADGRVIGINVAYIPPEARAVSIGFAIPAPTALDVVEQLLDNGEVDHAYLGVRLVPITPAIAERFDLETERGAIVLSAGSGTPAAGAGIEPGDVIVEFAGEEVRAVEDVYAGLRRVSPGDRVEITVVRDGGRRELEAEVTARPE